MWDKAYEDAGKTQGRVGANFGLNMRSRRIALLAGLVLPVWQVVEGALSLQARNADRRLKVLRLQTTGVLLNDVELITTTPIGPLSPLAILMTPTPMAPVCEIATSRLGCRQLQQWTICMDCKPCHENLYSRSCAQPAAIKLHEPSWLPVTSRTNTIIRGCIERIGNFCNDLVCLV